MNHNRSPWSHNKPGKHGPPRQSWRIFAFFLFIFGLIFLLILGGLAALVLFFSRAQAGGDTAVIVLVSACGLTLFLPMLAFFIAGRAFRGIARPLAEVMQAADAVAEGDLTARVPVYGRRNRFAQLTASFNRMIEELQRADEQRRNLTADVAHELRTPLHIIQGNLEGVLDGVYDPTPAHIEATLEETRTLARLVDDLHTLSQAEAGQLPLHLETVSVPDLLADVQVSFSGQAEANGVTLAVDLADEPDNLRVEGDAGRLDQVLSNLVANALRHTGENGRITLSAARQADIIHINVADTGEGIPAEALPYVFNRFWRGDAARSHTAGAGAGLGLAIAKQLVEAHQGTIDVTSTPGQGAEFRISLPAVPPAKSGTG